MKVSYVSTIFTNPFQITDEKSFTVYHVEKLGRKGKVVGHIWKVTTTTLSLTRYGVIWILLNIMSIVKGKRTENRDRVWADVISPNQMISGDC